MEADALLQRRMGCEPGSGGSWSDVSPSELESRYIIPCHPMSPRVTPWCQRGLQMVLSSCSTSGSDSSVSDGIPDDFHIPDQPVSPCPPLLRWEGHRARVEQGDRGSRCPSATLPPGTDGTTQEEATAKTESKKWSAPNQPEPHWHPGEPGATTVFRPRGDSPAGILCPQCCSTPQVGLTSLLCPPGWDPKTSSSSWCPEWRWQSGREAQRQLQYYLSQGSWSREWPSCHRRRDAWSSLWSGPSQGTRRTEWPWCHHGKASAGEWHKRCDTPQATTEPLPPWCQ